MDGGLIFFMSYLSASSRRLHGNPLTEVFQLANQVTDARLGIAAGEIIPAQVLVADPLGQQVVRDDQDRMCYRADRLLVTPAGADPVILRPKVAILAPASGQGSFRQPYAEPAVSLPCLPALSLAGALIIPGAHPRPTGQVARRRKAAPVCARLGDARLPRSFVNPPG